MIAVSACPAWAFAQSDTEESVGAAFHAQTTYIWQSKPAFSAAYSDPNSLSPLKETSYSFTVTGDLGHGFN